MLVLVLILVFVSVL